MTLENYLKQELRILARIAVPDFGPFKKISWLMIILLTPFVLLIITSPIFPEWYDAPVNYTNWVTGKPASRALSIGILILLLFVTGGIITHHTQRSIVSTTRKWISLTPRDQWSPTDHIMVKNILE